MSDDVYEQKRFLKFDNQDTQTDKELYIEGFFSDWSKRCIQCTYTETNN